MGTTPNDPRSLANQSGFWRRVEEKGAMRKSDVLHLREDLKRLEDRIAETAGGCAPAEVANELRAIRETLTKDFGTQALILQTLIEVLIDKGVMSEDAFADKLDEIDARDGVIDGTLGRPANEAKP